MKKLYPLLGLLIFYCISPTWAQAQSDALVLKPDQSISPYYSLTEWVLSNANIPFDSYDLNTFELLGETSLTHQKEYPLVFIDGVLQTTGLLGNSSFMLPNLSFSSIDSVVINYSKYSNGYYSSNGSIEIFLHKENLSLGYERALVNEINDPGPHTASELKSSNVEAINYIRKFQLRIPSFAGTNLLYDHDHYTRTNTLTYDGKSNNTLYRRTILKKSDGTTYLQRNVNRTMHLQNQLKMPIGTIDIFSTIRKLYSNYLWDTISGIETPFKQTKFQSGMQYRPQNTTRLKSINIHFSWFDSDSLTGAPSPAQKIEYVGTHSATHVSLNKQNDFYGELKAQRWTDQINSQNFDLINWSGTWTHKGLSPQSSITTMIGNAHSSIGFNLDVQGTQVNLETAFTDLTKQANYYTFWKNKIGYELEERIGQSVIDDSNHRNVVSSISFSRNSKVKRFRSSYRLAVNHYWNLSSFWTFYEPPSSGRTLRTNTTFTDHQQVGFSSLQFNFSGPLGAKLQSRTQLSTNLLLYGDEEIKNRFKQSPPISFNQVLQYRMHENAQFELIYRYISARRINAYETFEEQTGWPPVRVRPIRLLNATAKTWMFDRALGLTLSLRNLLNITESYNTNGQYYDMSIHVSAQLNIGRNNFR